MYGFRAYGDCAARRHIDRGCAGARIDTSTYSSLVDFCNYCFVVLARSAFSIVPKRKTKKKGEWKEE